MVEFQKTPKSVKTQKVSEKKPHVLSPLLVGSYSQAVAKNIEKPKESPLKKAIEDLPLEVKPLSENEKLQVEKERETLEESLEKLNLDQKIEQVKVKIPPAPPSSLEHKLAQRQKQIDMGNNLASFID